MMGCATKTFTWTMMAAVIGFFLGAILLQVQLDIPGELGTVNPGGSAGRALVVYHPGLSDFHTDVTLAFVDGLGRSDWAIDLTTAHRGISVDVDNYDLLVLGAPTYAWRPAGPIFRVLNRFGDLQRMPTVLMLTAAGSTTKAATLFVHRAEAVNANVIRVLEIWQAAPNEELHGISDAFEIARRAGAAISIP